MRWVILILLLLLSWLQYRLWQETGSFAEARRLDQELLVQQAELKRRLDRNAVLEAEVLDLRTGLEALEERARSELGMIHQGEIFYHVLPPEAVVPALPVAPPLVITTPPSHPKIKPKHP